ncbi:MAG: hypothetical protein AAF567_04360 [Actinomycetota bacterium]
MALIPAAIFGGWKRDFTDDDLVANRAGHITERQVAILRAYTLRVALVVMAMLGAMAWFIAWITTRSEDATRTYATIAWSGAAVLVVIVAGVCLAERRAIPDRAIECFEGEFSWRAAKHREFGRKKPAGTYFQGAAQGHVADPDLWKTARPIAPTFLPPKGRHRVYLVNRTWISYEPTDSAG